MTWFFKRSTSNIPADVPRHMHSTYTNNYNAMTRGTNRLFVFSADQRIEHLFDDFYGPGIAPDDTSPEHLFRIGSAGFIGALATHFGLIAQYGMHYPSINYIIKITAKTNLIPTAQHDPLNQQIWSTHEIFHFKQHTRLAIRGVGLTVYLGSQYEGIMLQQAAQAIYHAHQHGLLAMLWMYPRGKAIGNELDGALIAGAAGAAASLGADFAKIHVPEASNNQTITQWLALAAQNAGHTKLLIAGGTSIDTTMLLHNIHQYIHDSHIVGAAIGRNIHQKTLPEAIALTKALAAIIYENKSAVEAEQLMRNA